MLAILFAGGTFFTTLFGGFLSLKMLDRRHLLFAAAAGLMLGVIFLDLLPEALSQNTHELRGIPVALIAFLVGFLGLHAYERITGSHESGHNDEHSHATSSVLPLVLHSTLDGVGIGLAFQASASVGIVVALAVLAHDVADGFNTYSLYMARGTSGHTALRWLLADALAPMVGVLSTMLFVAPPAVLGALLGLFGGSLLYIATSAILPEAHQSDHDSGPALALTALGVLFIALVVSLAA